MGAYSASGIIWGSGFYKASADALSQWLSGATYADWDPRQLDRMFTTSTGPTNVASNGDTVGLLIGGSQLGGLTVPAYLATATDKVTNGGFSADANWSKGTGWSISGGVATHAAGSAGLLDQSVSLTSGRAYCLEYTVSGRTADSILPSITASTISGTARSTNGTFKDYFVASGQSTLRFTAGASFDGSIDNVSLKEIPGFHCTQSTSGDRPQYQSGYLRGDGSSDNLLTTWLAQNGANTAIAKAIMPGTVSATQILFGSQGAGVDRFTLGINTSGFLVAGVAGQATTTIVGTKDLRSKTVVVAVTTDGSTVELFAYETSTVTQEYSAAQSGSITAPLAARLGANNVSGTAGTHFAGDLGRTIAAQKAMSLAEFTSIAPLLAA